MRMEPWTPSELSNNLLILREQCKKLFNHKHLIIKNVHFFFFFGFNLFLISFFSDEGRGWNITLVFYYQVMLIISLFSTSQGKMTISATSKFYVILDGVRVISLALLVTEHTTMCCLQTFININFKAAVCIVSSLYIFWHI